ESFLAPDVLQCLGRESFLLGAVLAGDVAEIDLRVGGLLRRNDLRQRGNALIGDMSRSEPQFAAEPHGYVQSGESVEDRRFPRARESNQAYFHCSSHANSFAQASGHT